MARKFATSLGVWGAVCLAAAGCAGQPADDRPTVRIAPAVQPAQAIALGGFLPSSQDLSAALGSGPHGLMGAPAEGGRDMLLQSVDDGQAAPADCIGAPYRLQDVVYRDSPVLSVADASWTGGGFDADPVSAYVGVVQMGSAAAARDFFVTTTDRWRRCAGQTVALQRPGGGAGELSRVTDVTFDGDVVSATVLHVSAGAEAPTGLRAVGVMGDCVVDVEVVDPRAGGDSGAAAAVTGLVLERIAARR